MKVALVTGGAGFIGANFIHYTLENRSDISIINLDKLTYAGNLENLSCIEETKNYHFIKGDIVDAQLVADIFEGKKNPVNNKMKQIDYVINFAAESHVDRSIQGSGEFVMTNVVGTNNLLQIAKKAWSDLADYKDKRFIHVSTDEVYGSLGSEGKFTENTPYDPKNPYSASKAAADHLVRAYYHTYSFPAIITNCSNNYGPYQFPEKLIPLAINNALNNKAIPVYGKGENIRDWIYVRDHCRALDMVLNNGRPGQSYNIGGNSEKKNIEVVTSICEILDELLPTGRSYKELVTFVEDRPGHDLRYAVDYTKINQELGWKPLVSFEEGLKKTVKWYLDNRGWVENVTSGEYLTYYEKQYGNRQSTGSFFVKGEE